MKPTLRQLLHQVNDLPLLQPLPCYSRLKKLSALPYMTASEVEQAPLCRSTLRLSLHIHEYTSLALLCLFIDKYYHSSLLDPCKSALESLYQTALNSSSDLFLLTCYESICSIAFKSKDTHLLQLALDIPSFNHSPEFTPLALEFLKPLLNHFSLLLFESKSSFVEKLAHLTVLDGVETPCRVSCLNFLILDPIFDLLLTLPETMFNLVHFCLNQLNKHVDIYRPFLFRFLAQIPDSVVGQLLLDFPHINQNQSLDTLFAFFTLNYFPLRDAYTKTLTDVVLLGLERYLEQLAS